MTAARGARASTVREALDAMPSEAEIVAMLKAHEERCYKR